MSFVTVKKEDLDNLRKAILHLLVDSRETVSVADAARLLDVTRQTVHYMISTGKLEALEIEQGSSEVSGRKQRTIHHVYVDSLDKEVRRRKSGYVKKGRKRAETAIEKP